MLLAIDTSTALAGIALHGEDGPVASSTWHSGRMHTVQLLPAVDELLRRVRACPASLTGVGVAIGPGSFTGVRVGLATAKGIVGSLDIPLVGISTLLYTAWPHRYCGLPIRACLTLGRNRLAVGAYSVESRETLTLDWMRNLTPAEAAAPGRLLYCGELSAELRGLLRDIPAVVAPGPAVAQRNPAVLAALAWERLLRGETDQPAPLQAVYLDSN